MAIPSMHKQMELYTTAKKLVQVCYEIVQEIPEEERLLSGQKLRFAVLSAYIFIVQGLTQKPKKKVFKKAKTELAAVDGMLEIYKELNFIRPEKEADSNYLLNRCFELLKKPEPKN